MEMYARQAVNTSIQDDPVARETLRRAYEKTSRWPKDFKGFTAGLFCHTGEKEVGGSVTVQLPMTDSSITLSVEDEKIFGWLKNQIGMITIHRLSRDFDQADGKYALTFGKEDGHPLGRQIHIHGDGMDSVYRVKDDRILQIQRTMGKLRFSINVEANAPTRDGKVLNTHFTVFYFNVEDGQLVLAESYADTHLLVDEVYLHQTRLQTTASKEGVVVRMLALHSHQLLG